MLNKDQWLSSIIGKNVFYIESGLISQLDRSSLPETPALLMAKVPVKNSIDIKHLQDLKFFLIDTNIQLHKIRDRSNFLTKNLNIRFSNPSDKQGVLKIAANSFVYDRFHNDIFITQETANKIKIEWAKNYFRKARGDWMVIAEEEGIVCGFLQLIDGVDGALIIDLIAVDANYRNKGIAQKMINYAIQNCETTSEVVRVGTQIANFPSIALYLKMGFCITSAQYVFHYHS